MAVITELSRGMIDDAAERWGIGEVADFWPAADGIENTNYFVRARDDTDYVLTLVESGDAANSDLVAVLDAAEAAGLPVAPALRANDGAHLLEIEGKPALLCRRLPGNHVANPTFQQCEAIGRFLARLHLATAHLGGEVRAHPRDAEWLTWQTETAEPSLSFAHRRSLCETTRSVVSMLGRHDVASLPRGVIHGDLFRDNALFNDHGIAGVIDFHHAAVGFRVFDLAVAANDWCVRRSTGALDPDRTIALLRAYHRIRPLTTDEVWFFPMFALYAALAFWISRLVVKLESGDDAPAKDPGEFRRIAEGHQARAFYVDRRILD